MHNEVLSAIIDINEGKYKKPDQIFTVQVQSLRGRLDELTECPLLSRLFNKQSLRKSPPIGDVETAYSQSKPNYLLRCEIETICYFNCF